MKTNNVYHGDAIDLIDQLDLVPNLIIMSPPDLSETDMSMDEYKAFLNSIYSKALDKLHPNGVLASITTDRKYQRAIYTKHIDIINACDAELFNYKIWAKSLKSNLYILTYSHILFFRKDRKITSNKVAEFLPDVWHIPLDKVAKYKNKDSFPTELIHRIILKFSNIGDLVLDPFLGTGKTAKQALDLGREFIGFEINKDYVHLANEFIFGGTSG